MLSEVERRLWRYLAQYPDKYFTVRDLASVLGVAPSTVTKYVSRLRELGIPLESTRAGYRYSVAQDDLAVAQQYLRNLPTRLRYLVHYLPETTSTQDIAHTLAREGAPEGTVVLAEVQTRGRGRRGRCWYSPRGGLWFTLILRPSVPPQYLTLLTIATAVAVAEAVHDLTGLVPELKWPNDVLVEERKVCGILTEAALELDTLHYVLLGVGINVNNELLPDLRSQATSLHEVLGHHVPRTALLTLVLYHLDRLYTQVLERRSEVVTESWRRYSSTLGSEVLVYLPEEKVLRGVAEDIDELGRLVLRLSTGETMHLSVGEVVHVRSVTRKT